MPSLGDAEKHFWLTRSVARAMGVNLSEAMMSQKLTAADYAQMVTRCRECCQMTTCQAWLAQATSLSATAPEDCRNAKALEWLAGP